MRAFVYRVAYSERVRRRLLGLADVACDRGDGEAFLTALKEFHRRLGLYPQFGEPLTDLKQEPGQVWLGSSGPSPCATASLTPGGSSW